MPKQNNPRNRDKSGRPVGPDSRDPLIEEQEQARTDLRAQSDDQSSPDVDRQAGNRGPAASAFLESRGEGEERGEVY